MRSHERTMLARCGFDDQDRSDPMHDLACRYLSTEVQPEGIAKIAGLGRLERQCEVEKYNRNAGCEFNLEKHTAVSDFVHFKTHTEFAIHKGDGQYRVTIGFADVVFTYKRMESLTRRESVAYRKVYTTDRFDYKVERIDEKPLAQPDTEPQDCSCRYIDGGPFSVVVEVKTNPLPVSDVVRQVSLYRSHTDPRLTRFLIATTFPMTESQVQYLKNEGIFHCVLGSKFQRFASEIKSQPRMAKSETV